MSYTAFALKFGMVKLCIFGLITGWRQIKILDTTWVLGISYLGVSRSPTLAEFVRDNDQNPCRCGQRRYPALCEKIAGATRPDVSAEPDKYCGDTTKMILNQYFQLPKPGITCEIGSPSSHGAALCGFHRPYRGNHSWFGQL